MSLEAWYGSACFPSLPTQLELTLTLRSSRRDSTGQRSLAGITGTGKLNDSKLIPISISRVHPPVSIHHSKDPDLTHSPTHSLTPKKSHTHWALTLRGRLKASHLSSFFKPHELAEAENLEFFRTLEPSSRLRRPAGAEGDPTIGTARRGGAVCRKVFIMSGFFQGEWCGFVFALVASISSSISMLDSMFVDWEE